MKIHFGFGKKMTAEIDTIKIGGALIHVKGSSFWEIRSNLIKLRKIFRGKNGKTWIDEAIKMQEKGII